jgi:hypothetical protein
MGFFRRLARLFRGFLGLFIGGIEKQNPKALLDAHVQDFQKNLATDLPWQLQHWVHRDGGYQGNPILNRLDPAEYALENPWMGITRRGRGLGLSVGVSLSKRAVNRIRKKLGMPRLIWEV